jgi:exodeoxyribonuclease V beta subunit
MKGFIDLVFEHEGRFYLLDYKSNWLGAGIDCYRPPELRAEIGRREYYLQYLLYTLALHRYLHRRLPGYRYEQHFGAVYYLFLRGMDPALGAGQGVFRDRPASHLVEAMDSYFGGGVAVP